MVTAAVGWSLLAALLLMPSATFALEDCQYVEGQHVIAKNCRWQRQAATESGDVVLEGPPAGVGSTPPVLLVNSAGAVVPPKVTAGQGFSPCTAQPALLASERVGLAALGM